MGSKSIIRGLQFSDEGNEALVDETPIVKWLEYTDEMEIYEKRLMQYLHAKALEAPLETRGTINYQYYKSYVSTESSILDFFCTGLDEKIIVLECDKTGMDWISKAKRSECIAFSILVDQYGLMLSSFRVHCGNRRLLLALQLLQGLSGSDIEKRTRRYMRYQVALREINNF